MGVTTLQIATDHDPAKTLVPGQVISGKVLVHLEKTVHIQYLCLYFSGYANVLWLDTHNVGSSDYYCLNFSSTERYFDFATTLSGNLNGTTTTKIPRGSHSFPFKVKFPENSKDHKLPSSFESSVGHVRYELLALMKSTSYSADSKFSHLFTYQAMLDLNTLPDAEFLKEPNSQNGEEIASCCGFSSDPYDVVKVILEQQASVPGDYLNFKGSFLNRRRRKQQVLLDLVMVAKFHAQGGQQQTINDVVASGKSEVIPSGKEMLWGGAIKVPDYVPPTGLGGKCSIIDVRYELVFRMSVVGSYSKRKVEVKFPIMIGTVPLEKCELVVG